MGLPSTPAIDDALKLFRSPARPTRRFPSLLSPLFTKTREGFHFPFQASIHDSVVLLVSDSAGLIPTVLLGLPDALSRHSAVCAWISVSYSVVSSLPFHRRLLQLRLAATATHLLRLVEFIRGVRLGSSWAGDPVSILTAQRDTKSVYKMHPPLTLHRHPMCAEIIEQFQKCHVDHPIAKFFGECTDLKIKLDRCFREEKAIKRKANFEESKKLKERLQAYRKATAGENTE